MKQPNYYVIGGIIVGMFATYYVFLKLAEKRAKEYSNEAYDSGGIK